MLGTQGRLRFMSKKELKEFDVLPANVLRDEYGFNAENRPQIKVNRAETPVEFHDLIALVEKWAIPCDVTRHDVFEVEGEEAVASFYYKALPFVDGINSWLDSLSDDVTKWSEAAVSFMYFLKAHDEAYQPTDEEILEREKRFQAHRIALKKERDIAAGLEAFKNKDYKLVRELMSEYENQIEGSILAKFKLACKKCNGA